VTLLSAIQLAKSYAGTPALRNGTLAVKSGEVHALMGENGAGKSTLIRILAGVVTADGGTVELAGTPVAIASPQHAHRLGFRFIHQELNIVPQLSVSENILLERAYPRKFGPLIDWAGVRRLATAALATLGITHIDPATRMMRLAAGDRMLVKIASAFVESQGERPRIYVLDEPTAALNGAESERLFRVIATLRAAGCGIVYVSHRMDEVMAIADRLTVMRDGETRATLDTAATTRAEIITLMTGRSLADAYPPRRHPHTDKVALSVRRFSAGGEDVAFDLRAGEILGVAGLSGSGQGRLLRGLVERDPATRLDMRRNGVALANRQPADAWGNGFAYLPRERRAEGLILSRAIAENVTLPHLRDLGRLGALLDRKRERARTVELGERVRLKYRGSWQRARELSGGNQQKVVFARAVAGRPAILLLDEPTRGVDVGAKYDIYALLRELSADGLAIVMASSDLPELIGMTDRILVMRGGRQGALVETKGLGERDLLALCYGDGPLATAGV
jgi:ABC-type sugar transport system ATPase subunit